MTNSIRQSGTIKAPIQRNFHGRTRGRGLRKSQKLYLAEDLDGFSPGPVGRDVNPNREKINMSNLFGNCPIWLEIGFGCGEHMLHQASLNPGVGIIGCEPYVNGVATLLGKIREKGGGNIKIHPGDVRDLFDVVPDNSFERAFLLYPDPWPKKKHHRRRFVTPEYLVPLARAMRPGSILRISTDVGDYVRQALRQVPAHGFEWLADGPADWRRAWNDWISTRYEQKALREGRTLYYLTFRRAG